MEKQILIIYNKFIKINKNNPNINNKDLKNKIEVINYAINKILCLEKRNLNTYVNIYIRFINFLNKNVNNKKILDMILNEMFMYLLNIQIQKDFRINQISLKISFHNYRNYIRSNMNNQIKIKDQYNLNRNIGSILK